MAYTGTVINSVLTRDAHYHPIRATKAWEEFIAAEQAKATNTPDERAENDRTRQRETTYARGELGRH